MDARSRFQGYAIPLLIAVVLAGPGTPAAAAPAASEERQEHPSESPRQRAWTVHIDNDLFAFTDKDRDYTAGISVTLGGDKAADNMLSRALSFMDTTTRFASRFGKASKQTRSLEVGVVLFTPHDLNATEPLFNDRPYANLTYLTSTQLTHATASPVAYQSSLTVGFLGLPFAERLHRGAHDIFGSQEPMGYTHQISDGGEPTFRYTVSRYKLLRSGSYNERPYNLRLATTASIGYLTEANTELAFRWGSLQLPWWSSLPSASDYAGHPPIRSMLRTADGDGPRWQVSAGIDLRLRLYNSFLQGQFRSSDVTYSSSRLNHLLLEAWAGITTVFANDLSVSYTLRHQTEELKSGPGARGFTWASIGVAQQF